MSAPTHGSTGPFYGPSTASTSTPSATTGDPTVHRDAGYPTGAFPAASDTTHLASMNPPMSTDPAAPYVPPTTSTRTGRTVRTIRVRTAALIAAVALVIGFALSMLIGPILGPGPGGPGGPGGQNGTSTSQTVPQGTSSG